jgi:enoyl-CoA hydratase/carnithine racemase
MPERVTVDIDDRIARVTLNRPDKHNAVDRAMFEALIESGERLSSNRAVRVVILTGAGENFCAGIDVSAFGKSDTPVFGERDMRPRDDGGANLFQSAALGWRHLPVPVIAAVRGVAFGAGLQIAMGADLRFAAADSRWSVMEMKWGIIPDMGLSVTARGLVRPDRLKKLALTAAIIDGREAQQQGFVTELHDDPSNAALALARELSRRSPDAIRAVKALLNATPQDSEAALLRREARLQAALLGAPNQVEAVSANLHGRQPEFADPAE